MSRRRGANSLLEKKQGVTKKINTMRVCMCRGGGSFKNTQIRKMGQQRKKLGLARAVSVSKDCYPGKTDLLGGQTIHVLSALKSLSCSYYVLGASHVVSSASSLQLIITHTTAMIARLLYNVTPTSSFMC